MTEQVFERLTVKSHIVLPKIQNGEWGGGGGMMLGAKESKTQELFPLIQGSPPPHPI